MKIIARFPSIPLEPFDGSVVWRTIGVKAEPTRLCDVIAKSKEDVVKMNRVFARIDVKRGDARERMKWIKTKRETRYSDGQFPVVYASTEPQTSVVERYHWAFHDISDPAALGEFCIRLEVLTLQFTGVVKNLVGQCPPCVDLVHPSDYDCCIKVGYLASKEDHIDALLVPSARKSGGVNVALFKGRAVGAVLDVNAVTVFADGSPECSVAHMGAETFSAGAEKVYEGITT